MGGRERCKRCGRGREVLSGVRDMVMHGFSFFFLAFLSVSCLETFLCIFSKLSIGGALLV